MNRPLVLLSNDDGHRASGIVLLKRALETVADVVVCAPESEQSAMSHSLSLHRPLRLYEREPGVFSVDGTPADCVYVALHATGRVLPRRPDLVVSGLNHGVNLGDDVFYSGTVAAAREGALKGITSLAVSAAYDTDQASACAVAAQIVQALFAAELKKPLLLNVNVPGGTSWPMFATRLGARVYRERSSSGAIRAVASTCGSAVPASSIARLRARTPRRSTTAWSVSRRSCSTCGIGINRARPSTF